jgi:hypothetical protein
MANALWPTFCASAEDHDSIKGVLIASGFATFDLAGDRISDLETFFRTVISVVPNDPPLSGRPHLDALLDSVWEGFRVLGSEKVAILWKDADKILDRGLQDLIIISDLFQEIGRTLRGTEKGKLPRFLLFLVLFGNGPNFPRVQLVWNGTNLLGFSIPE